MILLLDVASPIPEFHLIKEKKIILSIKIVADINQKLSDNLIPTYLDANHKYNLNNKIKKLIITIGPGSYTALRVGASFIAGLSQSMEIPVATISTESIYKYFINHRKQLGVYFESSNNQKFFSYQRESKFFHDKIENNNYLLPNFISNIIYNINIPNFLHKDIITEVFSIKKIVIDNLNNLDFKKIY
jgi:Inactive homolog of metal-dependent proteases, putative molecular chaperone